MRKKNKHAEKESWAKIARSDNVEVFEAYLNYFPDGQHASAARAKIENIRNSKLKPRNSKRKRNIIIFTLILCVIVISASIAVIVDKQQKASAAAAAAAAEAAARHERFRDYIREKLGKIPRICNDGEYSKYTQLYDAGYIKYSREDGAKPADCVEDSGLKDFE